MSRDSELIRSLGDAEPIPWMPQAAETVLQSRWLSVYDVSFVDPRGRRMDNYYIVSRPDVAIACAVTEAGDLVLVRQFRCGIGRGDWELPGGALEDGENAIDAARRELHEEAGFQAAELVQVAVLDRDAASSAARIFVFLAHGRVKDMGSRPSADEPDKPFVGFARWSAAVDLIRTGAITEQSSVAALLLCRVFTAR